VFLLLLLFALLTLFAFLAILFLLTLEVLGSYLSCTVYTTFITNSSNNIFRCQCRVRLEEAVTSPKHGAMSPLTLPKRLSIFSLGSNIATSSSSLRRMSTTKVSRSTDALSSLDSPSLGPSTPVALTRSRAGLRSSFLNLFRPSHITQRRPSSPVVVDNQSIAITHTATLGRPRQPQLVWDRRPSDCSAELRRSAADEDDDDIEAGSTWTGQARSVDDRLDTWQAPAAPPILPRRPPHLLVPPSTPAWMMIPPPVPVRRTSPLIHVPTGVSTT